MNMPITQPGLEGILQALMLGGQPLGNLGQVPVGINPSVPTASPVATPNEAGQGNPAASAVSPVQAEQMRMLLEGLLSGGAFNNGGLPVG